MNNNITQLFKVIGSLLLGILQVYAWPLLYCLVISIFWYCIIQFIPHGIVWLNFDFIQCFVIILLYRSINYKPSGDNIEEEHNTISASFDDIASFSSTSLPEEPTYNAPRNVFSKEEINTNDTTEPTYSVRE